MVKPCPCLLWAQEAEEEQHEMMRPRQSLIPQSAYLSLYQTFFLVLYRLLPALCHRSHHDHSRSRHPFVLASFASMNSVLINGIKPTGRL